jgi:FG-GAP-like repeat/Domain of unknown function (DUF4214)
VKVITYFRMRSISSRLGLLLLPVAMVCAVQSAIAQGFKFNTPVTYPAGHPYAVECGDFNNDGKMDLVAGDVTNNDLVVLIGNGDGTLKAPLITHLEGAPYDVIANDFNRDGNLDLAIRFTVGSTTNYTSILLGRGDGSFDPPVKASGGTRPLAADFNGDGKADLVQFLADSSVTLSLNKGNGSFEDPKSYSFPMPHVRVIAAGDFDGDGKPDLVGYSRNNTDLDPRAMSVWPGNGDGTFRSRIDTLGNWPQGSGPYAIAVGDFDRDGKNDVVVSDEHLWVFKGNGDGTFRPPNAAASAIISTSVALKVADFNGDGKLDLVSSGVFSGGFTLFLGNGDGSFQNAGVLGSGLTSVSVVVVDLNGDTRPDLAGTNGSQLAVALLNATPGNPDSTDYFVHQHYVDFLNREPDADGFAYWANEIASCGTNQQCLEVKRINTSGAFYLSIEFQQTAYLIERLYKVSYGDASGASNIDGLHQMPVPIVRMSELLMDTEQIDQDVVVLRPGWATVLENNKQQFVRQFVQRSRFLSAMPLSLTPDQFVDRLNQNAGNVLTMSERSAMVALFAGAGDTSNISARAQSVRQVAEHPRVYNSEFNRAFVLMEYIGYFRRNPNEGQDADYSGYDFWLKKLDSFNGNFVQAEMVKAFISSSEYRQRFQ